MLVDYQEITQEEAKEITGGSILGYLYDMAANALNKALQQLAEPTI